MLFPTASYIRSLGVKPSRTRGQNFLTDRNAAEKAVDCAEIAPGDRVIEIGAGLGSLTFFLAERGARATCYEVDRGLIRILESSLPEGSPVALAEQDVLNARFAEACDIGRQSVLLGSIPYSITTEILLKFFREMACIKRAVFIMQEEVARRLCAAPASKDYGIFSVYCRAYTQTEILFTIPPSCFWPRPKVHSAAVKLTPLAHRTWGSEGEAVFRKVLRGAFSKRRKTLLNSLKGLLSQHGLDPLLFKSAAEERGLDLQRRAETLSVGEFDMLSEAFNQLCGPCDEVHL